MTNYPSFLSLIDTYISAFSGVLFLIKSELSSFEEDSVLRLLAYIVAITINTAGVKLVLP